MDLQEIRSQIDALDTELMALFCKRMALVEQVAREKRAKGIHVEDHAREREVIARVCQLAGEPLEQYARAVYSVLFDVSRSYQRRLMDEEAPVVAKIQAAMQPADVQFPKKGIVACQGLEGSYSQMACERLFAMPEIVYFKNFESVFQAVESGLCDYGILPIDNSSNGSINAVYDLMRSHKFHILRGINLHIDHKLLAKKGVDLSAVKEVVSHEQALGQCSAFLNRNPEIKVTVCENTAIAAKIVAEADRSDIAAISSRNCAEIYGLDVIAERIRNSENNYTRFICIAKSLVIYPGADCISIMLSTAHTPGALCRVMAGIAALGVNISKLESRAIPGREANFLFYMDLDASVWNEDVLRLIGELSRRDDLFAFLGNYSVVRG